DGMGDRQEIPRLAGRSTDRRWIRRAESRDVIELFRRALDGQPLPERIDAHHPLDAAQLVVPETRTSFGVIEMTTGCGRRWEFCPPDLTARICAGCPFFVPNRAELLDLYRRILESPGVA